MLKTGAITARTCLSNASADTEEGDQRFLKYVVLLSQEK